MKYWDNDFDRKFDEALDEMIKETRQEPTDEDLDIMYQEYLASIVVSNPVALIGAQ